MSNKKIIGLVMMAVLASVPLFIGGVPAIGWAKTFAVVIGLFVWIGLLYVSVAMFMEWP